VAFSFLPLHSQSLCKAVIDTAETYLYVREVYYKGQAINRSPEIDLWTKKIGLPVPKLWYKEGFYWCEIYVWNIVDKVYKAKGKKNPLMKTASVSAQLRYANKIGSGLIVIRMKLIGANKLISKGDIFCIKAGKSIDKDIGKLWAGHTGFIKKPKGNKSETNEGNTNKYGSRNGDRVGNKERYNSEFLAVIKYEH
jgi:hypothetical protein